MNRSLPTTSLFVTIVVVVLGTFFTCASVAWCDSVGSNASFTRAPKSVDSLIWKDQRIVRFIREELGRVNFRGYDHPSFSGYTFKDSQPTPPTDFSTFPAVVDPKRISDTIWTYSPNRQRAIRVCCEGEIDSDLQIFNWRRKNATERLGFCGTPCRYLGVYWLDDYSFISVRLDEVYENQPEAGAWKVLGHVGTVELYDLLTSRVYTYESKMLPLK